MKCFVAILLALIAVVMAVETTSKEEKNPEVTDVARDKRGLAYYSPYAYGAYSPYTYNLPYSSYAYPYYRGYHHYPYYNPYHY